MKSLKLAAVAALASLATLAHADTNVALGKSTTASSYYNSGSEVFPDAKVVDGITTDSGSPSNWSFWLSAQGANAGSWVQVDLGAAYDISHITLFDTHNRGYYDRGTQGFTLSTSLDGVSFDQYATGAFSYSQWVNQTALDITGVDTARYVRFTVDSCWGCQSAGLAEMQVYGTQAAAVPEPENVVLMSLGLALFGAAALRRSNR